MDDTSRAAEAYRSLMLIFDEGQFDRLYVPTDVGKATLYHRGGSCLIEITARRKIRQAKLTSDDVITERRFPVRTRIALENLLYLLAADPIELLTRDRSRCFICAEPLQPKQDEPGDQSLLPLRRNLEPACDAPHGAAAAIYRALKKMGHDPRHNRLIERYGVKGRRWGREITGDANEPANGT